MRSDCHHLTSSLTCGLTQGLYDPKATELNERHNLICVTHNSSGDNATQTYSVVICVGRTSSLGLCTLVNNNWIVPKQWRRIANGALLSASTLRETGVWFPILRLLHSHVAVRCSGLDALIYIQSVNQCFSFPCSFRFRKFIPISPLCIHVVLIVDW